METLNMPEILISLSIGIILIPVIAYRRGFKKGYYKGEIKGIKEALKKAKK